MKFTLRLSFIAIQREARRCQSGRVLPAAPERAAGKARSLRRQGDGRRSRVPRTPPLAADAARDRLQVLFETTGNPRRGGAGEEPGARDSGNTGARLNFGLN